MELRDSSLGWAKRLEISRIMRRKSERIKRGVKALNYRLELIENHLSKILKGARGGPRLWSGQAGGFLLTSRIPGTRLRAQRSLRSESPDAGRGADAEREGGILNG